MIQSVNKALTIIDCIAENGKMSLKQLCLELDMHKSTLWRMVQTLEARGYLEQDPVSGDYLLSYKFFKIGYDVLEKRGIRSCVLPVIKELAETTCETVNFAVLDEDKVLYLEKIEVSSIHSGIRVGSRVPVHCTASGKIMLANLSPEQLKAILKKAQPFEAYSENTIVSVDELNQQIADFREKGYAIARNELGDGAYAISAFVGNYPGREAAAVTIAGPQIRFPDDRFTKLSTLVISAAGEISRRLKG